MITGLLLKKALFFGINILIGSICDIVWLRYAYNLYKKSLFLLAIFANIVSWGVFYLSIMSGGSGYGIYWMVIFSKLAIYSCPLSKINLPSIFRPILFPLLIAMICALLLLQIPYFHDLKVVL